MHFFSVSGIKNKNKKKTHNFWQARQEKSQTPTLLEMKNKHWMKKTRLSNCNVFQVVFITVGIFEPCLLTKKNNAENAD